MGSVGCLCLHPGPRLAVRRVQTARRIDHAGTGIHRRRRSVGLRSDRRRRIYPCVLQSSRREGREAMTMIRTVAWVLLAVPLAAQTADRLDAKNASLKQTMFKGRSAIQLVAAPTAGN